MIKLYNNEYTVFNELHDSNTNNYDYQKDSDNDILFFNKHVVHNHIKRNSN